ncbi:MAG: hypothetical protein DRI56_03265 [Chloroflexota bacterium]|nr:MAG: hypothetical protein DRI56_03265 [Chloroflexota bacterium]
MLNPLKLYSWNRQPNGKYAIRNVEFFRSFSSPDRGSLDLEGLKECVKKIKVDQDNGHYLRVFCGHHSGFENRPGAGFLDNVHVFGETAIGDIIEIPENVFNDIKEGRYPYRSPEYVPEANKITGLALLESQNPFFVFPLLLLEEDESVMTEVQNYQLVRFQELIMIGDEIKDKVDEISETEEREKELTEGEKTEAFQGFEGDVINKLDSLAEKIANIASLLLKVIGLIEGKEPEGDGEKDEGGSPEGVEEKGKAETPKEEAPSSVAYQLRLLNRRLDELEQHNFVESSEITRFCESIGADPNEVRETLRQFSTAQDRKVYLKSLKRSFPKHSMSSSLERFQAMPVNEYEKLIAKYQERSPQAAQVARKAYAIYRDTVNQANAEYVRKFQAAFPSVEKWVNNAVEESERDPQYLDRLVSPI